VCVGVHVFVCVFLFLSLPFYMFAMGLVHEINLMMMMMMMIIFQADLSFISHIADKINKSHSMLGITRRNFKALKIKAGYLYYTFIMLYKSLVRSHLEYANSLWNPYQKQDIIQGIRKGSDTKLVAALRHKSYQEWLRILDLLL